MNFDKQIYDSGLIADGCWDQLDQYAKDAIMKFGELIVRECVGMAQTFHNHQYDFTGDLELHEFMLKHFGVIQ
jgi:hypothetical protein